MTKGKLIIVEGAPGAGKTRITKLLRENIPHTTLISLSSIEEDRPETVFLYHSAMLNGILDCNGYGANFVLDRSFISNTVYTRLGLKKYDFEEEHEWLCDKLKYLTHFYDIHLFILATNEENYAKRLEKRNKFQYVKHSARSSMEQQRKYMEVADEMKEKNLNIDVHVIVNTGLTPQQTVEYVLKNV